MKPSENISRRSNATTRLQGRRLLTGRWWLLAVPFLLLLVIAAACSDDSNDAPYRVTSANFPSDVEACQTLNDFKRYRYIYTFRMFSPQPEDAPAEITLPTPEPGGEPPFAMFPNAPTFDFGQTYTGSVANPARVDLVISTPDSPDVSMRWVDGTLYTKLSETWMPGGERPVNSPPALVCHSIMLGLDLTTVTPTSEKVGGLDTQHYRLDQAALETAGTLWGGTGDFARLLKQWDVDVWLTEDGWPARLETKSDGKYPSGRDLSAELSLEIKDPNAKDIKIEAPEVGQRQGQVPIGD